jgi:hypothetical protein
VATAVLVTGGKPLGNPQRHTIVAEWRLNSGENGDYTQDLAVYGDKSVDVAGTFGDATVTVQGTNETVPATGLPTNWKTLHDPQGNDLTFVVATTRIEQILPNPRFIRAIASGTTGSGLVVTIHGRKDRGAKS